MKLGQAHYIDALSMGLTGAINPMLRIDNNSTNASASALELRVEPGKAPMEVDSGRRRPTSTPTTWTAKARTRSG